MLTDNQNALLTAAAKTVKGIFDQIPDVHVDEIESAFVTFLAAENGSPKQTPIQLAENSLNTIEKIAVEINKPEVTAIVTDIVEAADDALEGKFFAAVIQAGHLIHDIKAAKK